MLVHVASLVEWMEDKHHVAVCRVRSALMFPVLFLYLAFWHFFLFLFDLFIAFAKLLDDVLFRLGAARFSQTLLAFVRVET